MKLRVISYNIHKCIGGVDRRYDLDRLCATIAAHDPDVLMLQEVDAGAARSNRDQQAEAIARVLGLPHACWYPNVQVRGGGAYGNAILSRFPITASDNIDITIGPKKRRSILHATVRVVDGEHRRALHLFNLHLGLAEFERKLQLRKFLDLEPLHGLHATTPIIVGGDFNDVWGGLGRLLQPAGFESVARPPRTFPAWAPLRALDAIYVRGARLHDLRRDESVLAKRASDHRPLIAEIVLPAQPG